MGYATISLQQRFTIALDALTPPERGLILQRVYRLIDFTPDRSAQFEAKRVSDAESLYLGDVGSGYRVFFRTDEATRTVEILDLVRQETLNEYARRYAGLAGR